MTTGQGSLARLLLSVLPLRHHMTLSQLVSRGLPNLFELAVLHATSATTMSKNLQEG